MEALLNRSNSNSLTTEKVEMQAIMHSLVHLKAMLQASSLLHLHHNSSIIQATESRALIIATRTATASNRIVKVPLRVEQLRDKGRTLI